MAHRYRYVHVYIRGGIDTMYVRHGYVCRMRCAVSDRVSSMEFWHIRKLLMKGFRYSSFSHLGIGSIQHSLAHTHCASGDSDIGLCNAFN